MDCSLQSIFDVYANVYSSSGARIGGLWSGTTTFSPPSAGVYLIHPGRGSLSGMDEQNQASPKS